MKTFLFWFFLAALILIHAVDMELTTYYIGDQWQNETFPLMKFTIKEVGIYNAIWISRVATYIFFLICWLYRKSDNMIFIMFLITVLYYFGMVPWLFSLHLMEWPLPPC
jgi:hypothetical protein